MVHSQHAMSEMCIAFEVMAGNPAQWEKWLRDGAIRSYRRWMLAQSFQRQLRKGYDAVVDNPNT